MIHIVLVQPEGPENVGSAARAMMNMDVESLILINPLCDHLSPEAFNYAVHAGDILKKAKILSDLKDALQGADLTAAITRRVGQWRKRDFYLETFAKYAENYRNKNIFLVFGREKNGLTNEEIDLCDVVCSIPSSDKFPSLNLAQAVMIVLYELFKIFQKPVGNHDGIYSPASRDEFDSMLSQIMITLDDLTFFKNVPESHLHNYLRKILVRASLDGYDTKVIRRIFKRIQGIVQRIKKSHDPVDKISNK